MSFSRPRKRTEILFSSSLFSENPQRPSSLPTFLHLVWFSEDAVLSFVPTLSTPPLPFEFTWFRDLYETDRPKCALPVSAAFPPPPEPPLRSVASLPFLLTADFFFLSPP